MWLKFSPLLPYLLDTLYCAVVNFPVSGSCTVARLSYKKRERTRTYSRSRQFWTFVLFCFAKPQVIGGFRLDWMIGNGFKSAKTFRKVAIRKATSKSRENKLTNFCCRIIVLSLFLRKKIEAVCKWFIATGFHRSFLSSRSLMFFKYSDKRIISSLFKLIF